MPRAATTAGQPSPTTSPPSTRNSPRSRHRHAGLSTEAEVSLSRAMSPPAAAQRDRLARVDLDVARLFREAAPELVDEDLRVRERHPIPLRAGDKEERPATSRSRRRSSHVRLDELHRVVDREAS